MLVSLGYLCFGYNKISTITFRSKELKTCINVIFSLFILISFINIKWSKESGLLTCEKKIKIVGACSTWANKLGILAPFDKLTYFYRGKKLSYDSDNNYNSKNKKCNLLICIG